jgi:putative membrane protein insertion efficiency factor
MATHKVTARPRSRSVFSDCLRAVMLGAVRMYQLLLSPWLGGRCRHLPSCSAYALTAIERFGPRAGGWLALKRIGRCHPWGTSGYDPVPEAEQRSDRHGAAGAGGGV